jgi:hypothetical protein
MHSPTTRSTSPPAHTHPTPPAIPLSRHARAEASAVDLAPQAPGSRIFANWSVYKTKGAMSVKFIKPTWTQTSGGGGTPGYALERCGRGSRAVRVAAAGAAAA